MTEPYRNLPSHQADPTRPASAPLIQTTLAAHLGTPDVSLRRTSETKLLMEAVKPLDLMANLRRSEASVVKTRTGSVLSRGFILKTDYYPSGQLVCILPMAIQHLPHASPRPCP